MRTAATNVGDAFHDFGLGFAVSIPIVLALFVASVWVYARRAPRPDPADATVRVNAAYWWCMMLAGVLGTLGGDFASFALHLTPTGAAIAFALLIYLSIRMFGARGMLLAPTAYWFTVALIRIGGTAGGDAFAHALRLVPSTVAHRRRLRRARGLVLSPAEPEPGGSGRPLGRPGHIAPRGHRAPERLAVAVVYPALEELGERHLLGDDVVGV